MESHHLLYLAGLINKKQHWKRFHFLLKGWLVQADCNPAPTPTQSCVVVVVSGGGSDRVGLGLVPWWVRRWDRVGFNASALHVGDELVRDFSQYVFSQPRHAEHMVTCAVHVVSERDKLTRERKVRLYEGTVSVVVCWGLVSSPRDF